MNKALILVDFQKEWTIPTSDYYVGDIDDIIENTNKLLNICREKNFKIIFTQHIEKDSVGAFAPNSDNVELLDEIRNKNTDVIITKYKISSFYKTDLDKHLEGIDEIVVGGILTNLCVRSLVEDAYDRDFQIKVIKNCCQALDEKTQDFTFEDLKTTREEIEFLDLEEFLLK